MERFILGQILVVDDDPMVAIEACVQRLGFDVTVADDHRRDSNRHLYTAHAPRQIRVFSGRAPNFIDRDIRLRLRQSRGSLVRISPHLKPFPGAVASPNQLN
jgi:hypothetical protein